MRKVLVLNGSNTGTTFYFAKKIGEEHAKKGGGSSKGHQVNILDLSKEFKGQLMTSETILDGSYTADADTYINMLLEADRIVVISSMTNYAISATMQAFINKVTVNGKTFAYGPQGVYPILAEQFKNKEVIVLFTSGSSKEYYPEAIRHVPQGLVEVFKFIGFSKVILKWGDGTNMPDLIDKSLDEKYAALRSKVFYD